jgi:hypothetical protein
LKRGSLPAGIVSSLFVTFATEFLFFGRRNGFSYSSRAYVQTFVFFTLALILHFWSLRRLEARAAEG